MTNIPDSLAAEAGAVVLNPSAIGEQEQIPQVWLGADLIRLLNPCECGGVNGFHKDECPKPSRDCSCCGKEPR